MQPADHRRVSPSSAASPVRLLVALIAAACVALAPAAATAAAPRAKKAATKRTFVFCVVAAKAAKANARKTSPRKARTGKKARAAALRVNRTTARRIARLRLAGHRVVVKRCATKTAAKRPAPPSKAKTPPAVVRPPAPPASGSGLNLGLVADTQGWGAQMGTRMDGATATGIRWLREEFRWSVIEPSDDKWVWNRYDQLMTEASKRNVHIVALAMTTPAWAGATWDTISDDPSEYAEYVGAVAGRYGPGGAFWAAHPELTPVPLEQIELLNEPFLPQFAAGDTNAGRYARLVRAATAAGRAANPAVSFLMALDTTSYDSAQVQHEWIDALYAAVPDLNAFFDGITVHPYGSLDKYTAGASRWQFRRIEEIRATLVEHAASDKGFWLTELGWPTCAEGCETEAEQADFVTRSIAMMRTTYADYVRGAFFYRYDDLRSSSGPKDREAAYGLKHSDGTPKPAWDALAAAIG